MPFNGDGFICFKYFKQVVESSNNVSRSTHLHVTQMDQNIKRTLLKPSMYQHLCQIRPSRTLLGEFIPSPPPSSSASPTVLVLIIIVF